MEQTCSTCKYWYSDADQQVIKDRGMCLMTTTATGSGLGMTRGHDESQATATAVVVSTFGYRLVLAQLETTAEFGCNQWEA